jgi:CubicO group peptidase (beta-lactamase class C family)
MRSRTLVSGPQRWAAVRVSLLILFPVLLGACNEPKYAKDSAGTRVDQLFSSYSTGIQPGLAIAVVRDGKIMRQGLYGYANVETATLITADTAFRLASVSKQFSAMAIMLLEADGKLSYDDPVSKYLPELQVYEGVTIRHLLLHTGGLPDYYDIMDTSAGMPTNRDAILLLQKLARADFLPGERYEYSKLRDDA